MTDQTVAQETDSVAKPTEEATGAQEGGPTTQDTLKAILSDFPEPGVSSDSEQPEQAAPESEADLRARMARLESRISTQEKDTASGRTQRIIEEFKGDAFKDLSDELIEAFLSVNLAKEPKLAQAWQSDKRGDVIKALRAELQSQMTPVNAEATADNEALVAAVRGAKTATPEPDKTPQQVQSELANMSDADFMKLKAAHDPNARRQF